MKKLSLHPLALSILATTAASLLPAPTQAQTPDLTSLAPRLVQRAQKINQSRLARARKAGRRDTAKKAICFLDENSGAGMTILKVPAMPAALLVSAMPRRFSLVTQ